MDFNQSLQHLLSSSPSSIVGSNASAKNSPMSSPVHRRGQIFNTLESPRSARKFSASMGSGAGLSNLLLDSPRKPTQGTIASGATLSRANQFRRMYTRLITKIETTCHRLGKDDKFQLFVCLSVHDRLLGRIVTDLTKAVAAQQLYEEHAFMRDPSLTNFLSHILEALEEISVPVDPALKETFEKHIF